MSKVCTFKDVVFGFRPWSAPWPRCHVRVEALKFDRIEECVGQ